MGLHGLAFSGRRRGSAEGGRRDGTAADGSDARRQVGRRVRPLPRALGSGRPRRARRRRVRRVLQGLDRAWARRPPVRRSSSVGELLLAGLHPGPDLGTERPQPGTQLAQAVGEVRADAGGREVLRGLGGPAGQVGARGEPDAEPEQPLHPPPPAAATPRACAPASLPARRALTALLSP